MHKMKENAEKKSWDYTASSRPGEEGKEKTKEILA